MKVIYLYILAAVTLCTLGACNTEDDVMEIFNDKAWKLVRLTTEDGKSQFYPGLWNSERDEENSRNALKQEGNFILYFNLVDGTDETYGTIEAHGIRGSISNASTRINGEDRSISIDGKITGSETDNLAKAFLNGLLNVFKYEGDSGSLTLYFKDGNTTKVMGFVAQ